MKKKLLPLILSCLPMFAHSYTECARQINNIWNNLGSDSIWVTFQDNGSPIYKSGSQLTPDQMGRFLSMMLTAQATNRSVLVRYPEDDLVCPPMGDSRNDAQGVWLTDE